MYGSESMRAISNYTPMSPFLSRKQRRILMPRTRPVLGNSEFHVASEYPWSIWADGSGARRFLLHPTQLARQRRHCAANVERVRALPSECVLECNVCDSEQSAIIASQDRYGCSSRTAMCLGCGLIYLVDRLTEEGYAEFYGAGHYRALTHAFNGAQSTVEEIHADQDRYADKLITSLRGYANLRSGGRLLDIGGSAGRVALKFQKSFGVTATVIDPAAEEVAAARKLGLEGITGSIEKWSTNEKFDLILICRSIEHVHDLQAVLSKARRLLCPEGVLFCDIVDFSELCRSFGNPEAITKMDHCYWLTQETAPVIFRSLGLDILSMNIATRPPLVGYLLKACEPSGPAEVDQQWLRERLRNLRDTSAQWQEWGRHSYDAEDWLRNKTYAFRHRLFKFFKSA